MGTISTTKFYHCWYEKDGKLKEQNFLGAIYKQYDGYISGYGKTLKKLLENKKVINGICNDATTDTSFNGIGCLGAWVIAQLKTSIGEIYLTEKTDSQDFDYEIYNSFQGDIMITVFRYGKKIYDGNINNFSINEEDYNKEE